MSYHNKSYCIVSHRVNYTDATLTAKATAVGIASTIWDLGSALLHNNYLSNSSGILVNSPRNGRVGNLSASVSVNDCSITGHGNSKSSNNICDSVIISGVGIGRCYSNSIHTRSDIAINATDVIVDNCTYEYGMDTSTSTGTSIGSNNQNSICVRSSTSLLEIDSTCTNTTAFNNGKYKSSSQTIKDRKRDKERGMSLDSGLEDKISAYRTAPQTPGYGLGSYFGSFLAASLMKSAAVVGAVVNNTAPSHSVRYLEERNSLNVTATVTSSSTMRSLGSRVRNNNPNDMNSDSNNIVIYNNNESQCNNKLNKGSDSHINSDSDGIRNDNGVHNYCDNTSLTISHTPSHNSVEKDNIMEMNATGRSSKSSYLPNSKHKKTKSINYVSDFISDDFSVIQQRELNLDSLPDIDTDTDTGSMPQSMPKSLDYLPLLPQSIPLESSDVKLDIAVQEIQKILQAVRVVGERERKEKIYF